MILTPSRMDRDTVTYFYYEASVAESLGWIPGATGCIPPPPTSSYPRGTSVSKRRRRQPHPRDLTVAPTCYREIWEPVRLSSEADPVAVGVECGDASYEVDDVVALDPVEAANVPIHPDDVQGSHSCADRLREEALSIPHLLTHIPKNPYCRVCIFAKTLRTQ